MVTRKQPNKKQHKKYINKQYNAKAFIAQMPGYEFISKMFGVKKTCNITRVQTIAHNSCMTKTNNKTQCDDTPPNPTGLPSRKLCKQHTETNIETNKPNMLSQYFQSTHNLRTQQTRQYNQQNQRANENITDNTKNA